MNLSLAFFLPAKILFRATREPNHCVSPIRFGIGKGLHFGERFFEAREEESTATQTILLVSLIGVLPDHHLSYSIFATDSERLLSYRD